jgi:peptidyl-prolyl cis-trans isomerase D
MPFAAFRRHQKKYLAFLTIFAMFGFVLADSFPKLIQAWAPSPRNTEVVTLFGRPVRQGDLNRIANERARANTFISAIEPRYGPNPFGGISTRELVDALILEHQADELGIAPTVEFAKDWLTATFKDKIDGRLLEQIYAKNFHNQVTDEQLLFELANQVRIMRVRTLPVAPVISPFDVFQAYRDQNERVSVNAVAFTVDDYISQVPEPKDSDLEAFYARYKDQVEDPARGVPGFALPSRAKVEFLTVDGKNLGVTAADEEVRALYEKNKAEGLYTLPPLKRLPEDPFEADASPEAVHLIAADWDKGPDPERHRSLEDVRFALEDEIIREKMAAAIEAKFEPIREAMNAYYDARATVIEEANEGSRGKDKTPPNLPKPIDLKALADKNGLVYDSTPPLTREQADRYGQIGGSRLGSLRSPSPSNVRFGDWLFSDRAPLYEPVEFTDVLDRAYLAWKTEDLLPETPPLKAIRDEVVRAWKVEQARPLAKKAAEDLAKQAQANDGDLRNAAGDRQVLATSPVSRLQPSPNRFAQFMAPAPPRPNDVPPLIDIGEELRDAVFSVGPGQVVVAPNEPRMIYYAVALNDRIPASFESLYGPMGERFRLMSEAMQLSEQRQLAEWMIYLRRTAGLDESWVPPDEGPRRKAPTRG